MNTYFLKIIFFLIPLHLFQISTDKEIPFASSTKATSCISCNTYYETSFGEKYLGYRCKSTCENTAYIQLCIEYTYGKTYPKYVVLEAGKERELSSKMFKRIYRFQYGSKRSDLDGNCDVK